MGRSRLTSMQAFLFSSSWVTTWSLMTLPQDANQQEEAAWLKCLPEGFKSAIVKNNGEPFRMAVLEAHDIVSDSVTNSGSWEVHGADDMASRVEVRLPKSGTFLDIGANLGYYSLLFAKKGYNVIAIEPSKHNRLGIRASLCMNPDIAHLVKLVPAALTSPEEVAKLRCVLRSTNTAINIGNMFLKCGSAVKPCGEAEKACEDVRVRTLNSVLKEVKPASIDVVKMDIEGHECQALAGGDALFSKFSPKLVQVETAYSGTACLKKIGSKFSYKFKGIRNAPGDSTLVKPSISMSRLPKDHPRFSVLIKE